MLHRGKIPRWMLFEILVISLDWIHVYDQDMHTYDVIIEYDFLKENCANHRENKHIVLTRDSRKNVVLQVFVDYRR